MEFGLFLCCLLGVVILPVVNNAAVTLTTPAHHTQPIGQDHLLIVLTSMHQSDTFHKLSSREKIFLVELLAAAEVDAVTHYIDTVGFDKFLQFLDVVTKLNATEAHLLEHYMVQRDLATMLAAVQNNPAAQALPADDKALLEELIRAAETHTLTPVIHREGYAKIVQLIEDIGTVTETHTFITYLVAHMNKEAAQHSTT